MAISIYSAVVFVAALAARMHMYVSNKRLRHAEARREELLRGIVLRWTDDTSDSEELGVPPTEQVLPEQA